MASAGGPTRRRRQAWNEEGHAHEYTFSTYRRQPFMLRPGISRLLLESVVGACTRHACELWAYVVMPEHVHVLLRPTLAGYDVSEILRSIKSPAARAAFAADPKLRLLTEVRRPSRGIENRFWQQGGGYDRNLFTTEAVRNSIAYIHLNPVRRELCQNPEDWHWSSARDYAGQRGSGLVTRFDEWNL